MTKPLEIEAFLEIHIGDYKLDYDKNGIHIDCAASNPERIPIKQFTKCAKVFCGMAIGLDELTQRVKEDRAIELSERIQK